MAPDIQPPVTLQTRIAIVTVLLGLVALVANRKK